jgi:beta-barrel assembly-enhancing protease
MNRRRFVALGCSCALAGASLRVDAQEVWTAPNRFARPESDGDEGGLWAMMDREEARLRRSPFLVRDSQLNAYVQKIACQLAGDHCADLRVYVVDNPLFNASMAPNGMMQVWSGLLLRADNEAQLAAVLGHEIGHYLERHTLNRLREVKSRAAFAQFLGMFGLVGLIGQVATLASTFAFSREQELTADRIGATLMRNAGYDAAEAGRVWANLLAESEARLAERRSSRNPLIATHPAAADRRDALNEFAANAPGGSAEPQGWNAATEKFRFDWLTSEIKRGQHEESIALLDRKVGAMPSVADYWFARAEIYRLRGTTDDHDRALADYEAAIAVGNEPAATHRGIGLIRRSRRQSSDAVESFSRYLEAAPGAPDAAMFKHYIQELAR